MSQFIRRLLQYVPVAYLILLVVVAIVGAGALAQGAIVITDYGAVPNDGNDDTLAIQSAIGSAQPGDTVLIPAGTFHVSASIVMGGSNVRLQGDSQATSVLQPIGATNFNPIILSGDSNTVRDFTIDGRNTAGFANAIFVGGVGATVDQMTIKDLNATGFPHGIYAFTANNVTVSNSTFENIHVNSEWGAAIRFQGGDGGHFFSNTIRNAGRGGIFVNEISGFGSSDIRVHDNVIENSGMYTGPGQVAMAIEMGPYTTRAIVENNTVDHWISIGPVANQVAVRRNTVGDARYVVNTYGLEAAGGTTNIVMSDNVVTGGNDYGLLIANINTKQHMLFRDNVFAGASRQGMLIQGDAPPITTTYFYQNEIVNNAAGGAVVSLQVNHVTFDRNIISNNNGHGIALSNNNLNALSFVNNQIQDNSGSSISGNVTGPDLEWSGNTVSGNGNNRNLISKGFSNAKPNLSFVSEVEGVTSTTVKVGDLVDFVPSFSDPNLGDSMSAILWDFDFGWPVNATSPSVVFTEPGDYRVTALAWDQAGRGALAEQVITVLSVQIPEPGAGVLLLSFCCGVGALGRRRLVPIHTECSSIFNVLKCS